MTPTNLEYALMTKFTHVTVVVCLMLGMVCFCGCGKKGEYKGYVHVTQAEAETFAEQLIAKFKQGDKQPFYDFGIDMDAVDAAGHLTNVDISAQIKMPDLSAEERKVMAEGIAFVNHDCFDSLKNVELVETKELLGLRAVVLDCKFDQTSRSRQVKEQKYTLQLLKKKSSGEIVVASYMPGTM